jgi:Flp pilus assembly protein CpaB
MHVKATWAIVAGLILGIAAVFLINRHITAIEARQVSQPFLKLSPDKGLGRGEAITADALDIVRLPEEFVNLKQFAVPYNRDTEALIASGGAVVVKDVAPGSVLLFEHIIQTPDVNFASQIGEGMRALSIPVTAMSAVSYFVGPGSRVDILATMTERAGPPVPIEKPEDLTPELMLQNMAANQQRLVTKTLLQNVRVMAVGSSISSGSYLDTAASYDTVTFEVTPIQAELLTFALGQAEGGLSLVLRNPENTDIEPIPSVGWENLERPL